MSLVGSLEDLCLADILQIVSLSRKSGLLLIHSEEGEGRIVFFDGLVRAAFVKEEAADLRALLVTNGFLPPEQFDRAVELARARGDELDEIIPSCTDLTKERLDSLRREHIERAVFRIFSWRGGEFSFEVRDEVDTRDSEILLPTGINPEYLSMEATRLADEGGREENEDLESDSDSEENPLFSGDELAAQPPDSPDSESVEPVTAEPHEVIAEAVAAREVCEPEDEVAETLPPAPAPEVRAPSFSVEARGFVIAIDPELATLEWQKAQLRERFERVHIFQGVERGITRIRQYLGRGQMPIVLVSADLQADPSIGIRGAAEFVSRLKQQTPSMPVLVVASDAADAAACVDDADGLVIRPHPHMLASRHYWEKLGEEAEQFREQVVACLERVEIKTRSISPPRQHSDIPEEHPTSGLERLREMSDRIRDPAAKGEVLSRVLEFAAETFSRVAMFMVRDDSAIGMVQRGLPATGGPGDDEFRTLDLPIGGSEGINWFQQVLSGGSAIRATPDESGDLALVSRLGEGVPSEAYVAPIESGGRVVALLYADNLPGKAKIGDTTILEIVLHEAGLTLERALLEHALARAGTISAPDSSGP